MRVVVGDLTFLHDATALVRGHHERDVDLQVIVFDDSGGSIFGSLEYGSRPGEEFERLFATPPELDILEIARSLGADASECAPGSIASALTAPIVGRSVIRVPLERA